MNNHSTRLKRFIYSTLWLIGLGTGANMQAASAATPDQQIAEEACREALELNTIDALEAFLMKYPNANTACRAKALSRLNEFADSKGGANNGIEERPGEGYGG